MYLKYAILFLSFCLEAFSFNNTPICTVYTPDSILHKKEHYKPLFLNNRMRYATCTGATWFHGNYLATVNLYGESIITYSFDEEKKEFNILQQIKNNPEIKLQYPEHLAISPDGTLLAVCNNKTVSCINIYAIDVQSHLINPTPIFVLNTRGFIHNVRFTSDGTYLAYASFEKKESICVYKVLNNPSNFNLEPMYKRTNNSTLKAKGINFTQDNHYVVLAYAYSINNSKKLKSLLVSYKFNPDGTLGKVICSIKGTFSIEDIDFCNNDNAIVVSDQGNDMLLIYPFNPKTGQIENNYTAIQNPEAQLSFPHGVSVSQDGKYLVATNYGDDKFNLYQID